MTTTTNRTRDHLRVDRLPGVGTRYEIGTIDGQRLIVVIDRHGDRHISLRSGGHGEEPDASAVVSERQSSLLALILTDTLAMAQEEPLDGVAGGLAGLSTGQLVSAAPSP